MKSLKNKIPKNLSLFEKLFLLVPFAIWFSYWPNFHFGKSEGANLEFSLPLILCVILAVVAIYEIFRQFRRNSQIILKDRAILLTGGFVVWNFLTIFWGFNPLRTFLTAGIWAVLWVIFVKLKISSRAKKLYPLFTHNLILASGIVSILTILQVAIGAFTDWGLCRGCVASGFGFARPSLFAIEPQFLGSLLLAPILLVWWKILSGEKTKFNFWVLGLSLIALYLTLSRGAIFAVVPAMLLGVLVAPKNKLRFFKRLAILVACLTVSFTSGMLWHALWTELNPRVSDGFYDSINKSVNQLSLGKISLPKAQPVEKPVENQPSKNSPQTESSPKTEPQTQNSPQKASFDGYVEKSTDERTKLSSLALQTWQQNPRTILLGVGAGGAGKAILQITGQIASAGEIVQNEFLSILLELGIVGLAIWLAIWLDFIWQTRSNRIGWLILLAFMLQWFFFSGLPNALHIYLILAIFFAQNSAAKN